MTGCVFTKVLQQEARKPGSLSCATRSQDLPKVIPTSWVWVSYQCHEEVNQMIY